MAPRTAGSVTAPAARVRGLSRYFGEAQCVGRRATNDGDFGQVN